jgi:hypothetical protein
MNLRVRPLEARGFSFSYLQLFGARGPRWEITCGNCARTWSERIPMIDNPGLACPSCGAVNVLPLEVNGE